MDNYLYINLQLFSEEKTESATPKKLRDARKKGQVPVSKDLSASFILLFVFLVMNIFSNYVVCVCEHTCKTKRRLNRLGVM